MAAALILPLIGERGIERLLRHAILDELDADEEAAPANVADEGVVAEARLEP